MYMCSSPLKKRRLCPMSRRIELHFCLLLVVVVPFVVRTVHSVRQSRMFTASSAHFGLKNVSHDLCLNRVISYHPSEIELSWMKAISNVKSDEPSWEKGCQKVRAEESALLEVVSAIHRHMRKQKFSERHLSSHQVEDCTGVKRTVYLEPLVSFLRHPLALCVAGDDRAYFRDKSYLLVPHQEEVTHSASYKWLFDAGASTYNSGAGGASQSWFVNTYRARGIEFDRIIGWEARPMDPKSQWSTVPDDIKRKTSWYNIPANATVDHADNPLTYIKKLTKPEDFVVFKLDIDTPQVEVAIVQQILNDAELHTLIDEFYFEHHVTGSPMQWHGWGNLSTVETPLNDITDSYELFSYLRTKGIRSHSWV